MLQVLENLKSSEIRKLGFQAWKALDVFVEVLESFGIWLYVSYHKNIGIQSLHFFRNIGAFLCVKSLRIH